MADPLRKQILDNLVTVLQGIDGTGNYRTTVQTVELAGRAWDEPQTRSGNRPYIGIIPQEETYQESPVHLTVTWRIILVAHVTCSRTLTDLADKCQDITTDIRLALYDSPSLGLDGVIRCSMVQRFGSEGSPQAAEEGIASVQVVINVVFYEGVDEA